MGRAGAGVVRMSGHLEEAGHIFAEVGSTARASMAW